jgi:hypothetical protein
MPESFDDFGRPFDGGVSTLQRENDALRAQVDSIKDKLRHHYANGDYDHRHNCRASITLNALRQSLGL